MIAFGITEMLKARSTTNYNKTMCMFGACGCKTQKYDVLIKCGHTGCSIDKYFNKGVPIFMLFVCIHYFLRYRKSLALK